MPLGINDGKPPRSMEFEVGEGGAGEKNGLVARPALCDDASSSCHQISHALPRKGVEDAVLDKNTAPGALAKAESRRLHHHRSFFL